MGIKFNSEYEDENRTPTVLLLGNGFDLQLGLKSKYEDFLIYLYMLDVLQKTKDSAIYGKFVEQELEHLEIELFEIKDESVIKTIDIVKDALGPLYSDISLDSSTLRKNNILLSILFSILKQDCQNKVDLEDHSYNFCQIEITENDFNIQHINKTVIDDVQISIKPEAKDKIRNDFHNFLNIVNGNWRTNDPKKVNGWLDIECLIECLITKDSKLISRFSFDDSFKLYLSQESEQLDIFNNPSNAHSFLNNLTSFTREFCKYIDIQISIIKKDKNYKYSLYDKLKSEKSMYWCVPEAPYIVDIDLLDDIYAVLNYNYSPLSDLIDAYSNKILHVNGCSEKNTAIFGINENYDMSVQNTRNQYGTYFYKQTQRVLNHLLEFNFDQLLSLKHLTSKGKEIVGFNMIIFGHSCSPADFDIIKKLLIHPNLRLAVILCYDKKSFLSSYHNIRVMIGPEKLYKMMQMSSSIKNRLIFVERAYTLYQRDEYLFTY